MSFDLNVTNVAIKYGHNQEKPMATYIYSNVPVIGYKTRV
jgi:hypothetical protein